MKTCLVHQTMMVRLCINKAFSSGYHYQPQFSWTLNQSATCPLGVDAEPLDSDLEFIRVRLLDILVLRVIYPVYLSYWLIALFNIDLTLSLNVHSYLMGNI